MVRRSYRQFCPTARSLDLVGERWTLLIVRDLLRGPRRYTDLRTGLPGMASNLLAQRLAEMEAAGLIQREHHTDPQPRDVYVLTERGRELRPVLLALGRFGLPYLDLPTEDEPLIEGLVSEAITTLVLAEELPSSRLTIDLTLDEGRHLLTVAVPGPPGKRRPTVDRLDAEEIAPDATVDADVQITGSLVVLLWIRRGDLSGHDAIDQGLLSLAGEEAGIDSVRRMFGFDRGLSPPAPPG